MNRRARTVDYQGPRTYLAANYASRTMRWTGVIVLLYLAWHLADFTWGTPGIAPDGWEHGAVYNNFVLSFEAGPGVDPLHRRQPGAGRAHLPRRMVDVPEPWRQQPEIQCLATVFRHRDSRR